MCRTQISLTWLKMVTTTGNWAENMSNDTRLPRGTSAECPDYNHLTSLFIPSSNTQSLFRLTEWPTDSAALPAEPQIRHHYNTNQLRTQFFWVKKKISDRVWWSKSTAHWSLSRKSTQLFFVSVSYFYFWLKRVVFIRGKTWQRILPVWLKCWLSADNNAN